MKQMQNKQRDLKKKKKAQEHLGVATGTFSTYLAIDCTFNFSIELLINL